MSIKRKKICLIFMGGTDVIADGNKIKQVNKQEDIAGWMKEFPELKIMADITPIFLTGKKAVEIGISDWIILVENIHANRKKFDGFIITHGSETVLYTANAVKVSLSDTNKPIIFTGSQLNINSEGRNNNNSQTRYNFEDLSIKVNLISSLQVAVMGVEDVAVMYGNKLISAEKAITSNTFSLNSFDAVDNDFLGRADFNVKIYENPQKQKINKQFKFFPRFSSNIGLILLHPCIFSDDILRISEGKSGIIFYGYEGGGIPAMAVSALRAVAMNLPVFVYSAGKISHIKKINSEAVFVNNISLEALMVRLMWAVAQTKNRKKINKIINQQ